METDRNIWKNLINGQTWLRGVFMLLFVVIYGFTEVILTAVVVLQFLFVLISGKQNHRLKEFGQGLSLFIYRIIRYWTYNLEEKPFPFSPWPGNEGSTGGK